MRACARSNHERHQDACRSSATSRGEVGEHDVGAGALDREQVLERDRGSVDPAELRRSLHHRVLAAHVVRRDRHVERAPYLGDHVEVRQRGLDHHHVGALVDVVRDLDERLAPVGGIHLVAPAVAGPRRALGRVAERAVERRGVLGRVREDRDRREPGTVERGADRRRPGRPSFPTARSRRRRRRPARPRCSRSARASRRCRRRRSLVSNPQWPWSVYSSRQSSAISTRLSPTSSRSVRSATCITPLVASACRAAGVLGGRDPEQHHGRDAEIGERPHLFAQALLRVLHDAGHRRDRFGRVDALLHEQRRDEVIEPDAMLRHQTAERGRAPQPAHPVLGKGHRSMVLRGLAGSVSATPRVPPTRGPRSCADRPRRRHAIHVRGRSATSPGRSRPPEVGSRAGPPPRRSS